MKKIMLFCAVACAAMVMTSCKQTKDSAYKQAYEKAAAIDNQAYPTETTVPTVAPVVETVQPVATADASVQNATVISEQITLISGSGLKAYSVVLGSFGLKANAEGLQNTLRSAGYDAQIVYNAARNMYRVVATTFDTKAQAVTSRDQLRGKYPDAWLLYRQ